MDLPPPSYEAATGESRIHNQKNPNSKSVSPTAPPSQDDEIITVDPETTPIFPRPYRSNLSSNVQPNNQNLHPQISPKPETTYLDRDRNKKCTPVRCYCVIIFIVCAVIITVVIIAKYQQPKFDFRKFNENHHNVHNTVREYEDKWWKDNEQNIKDIHGRGMKWK